MLATISGNALVAPASGIATTAAYSGVALPSVCKRFETTAAWSAGDNTGSLGMITNPHGLGLITDITTGSLHVIITPAKIDIGIYAGSLNVLRTISFAQQMQKDGTIYQNIYEVDGDEMSYSLWDGTEGAVSHADILAYNGQFVTVEHFRNTALGTLPVFHSAFASVL
ncbi:hypothetical protein [Devosia sp.]|uniref:hypothetical protein n=1 Tax=Devosia sp. TaxID=1871048 RepID=UPI00262318B0|nr:hypothetical protein [Devosia sp.]